MRRKIYLKNIGLLKMLHKKLDKEITHREGAVRAIFYYREEESWLKESLRSISKSIKYLKEKWNING